MLSRRFCARTTRERPLVRIRQGFSCFQPVLSRGKLLRKPLALRCRGVFKKSGKRCQQPGERAERLPTATGSIGCIPKNNENRRINSRDTTTESDEEIKRAAKMSPRWLDFRLREIRSRNIFLRDAAYDTAPIEKSRNDVFAAVDGRSMHLRNFQHLRPVQNFNASRCILFKI